MEEIQIIPSESAVIKLTVPYKTNAGEMMEEVTMRAPTVRDRLIRNRSQAPGYQADIDMIASLCQLTTDDLMNMEACDFLRLETQFNDFLQPPAKRTMKV